MFLNELFFFLFFFRGFWVCFLGSGCLLMIFLDCSFYQNNVEKLCSVENLYEDLNRKKKKKDLSSSFLQQKGSNTQITNCLLFNPNEDQRRQNKVLPFLQSYIEEAHRSFLLPMRLNLTCTLLAECSHHKNLL